MATMICLPLRKNIYSLYWKSIANLKILISGENGLHQLWKGTSRKDATE